MKVDNTKHCVCGSCTAGSIIWSIIGGIVSGVLFYLGYITSVTIGIWIAFGIAAFSLIFVLMSVLFSSCNESCAKFTHCLRKSLKCLLIGIVGTIVLTIVALSIFLAESNVIFAIIVGLVALFFIILISALVDFLKCVMKQV